MAVEKVRQRLLISTAALDRHGVPYAVIGGNAVAVWVAEVDEDAVRNTVDVNILLRREDLPRATQALAEVGFDAAEVLGIPVFVERVNPKVRRGIRVLFAGEQLDSRHPIPTPDLSDVHRARDGFAVIGLRSLLIMKLNANRLKDKVHIQDMLELGMIDQTLRDSLPDELRRRLDDIISKPE